MSIVAYGLTCALGALGFFAVGERWQDRRERRAARRYEAARQVARDADAVFDGFVRAEIPHLYLAPAPCVVIDARDRFAARRAVAGGHGGGAAA